MITFSIRLANVAVLVGILPLASIACGSNPPPATRTPLSARADTGTATDATAGHKETPQQASNSGSVAISDDIRAACGIGVGDAFFGYDSYALQNRSITVLNKVATCFTSGPLKGRNMKLVGHADPRGASEYNMTLGMNRADSVANYVHRQGVASSQTESTSRGAMDAVGTNEATWAKDRSVDVLLAQ